MNKSYSGMQEYKKNRFYGAERVARLSPLRASMDLKRFIWQSDIMLVSDDILYENFIRDHNEEALATLIERHKDGLTVFLYGYVHNWEDAEDLMIDSFAQVAAGRTLFSGRSSFKTWLFAVGRNLARMHLRKNRFSLIPLDDMPIREAEEKGPAESVLQDERKAELHKALEQMGGQARHVLELLYFEEMSYDEVAKVLGKTRKQVYRMAERYRGQLKNLLGNEGG